MKKSPWAKPAITPLAPIPPISDFTDADFFRRCVIERSASFRRDVSLEDSVTCIYALLSEIKDIPAISQTEGFIMIAALCERAAVDITIPNSRTSPVRPQRQAAKSPSRKKKGAGK